MTNIKLSMSGRRRRAALQNVEEEFQRMPKCQQKGAKKLIKSTQWQEQEENIEMANSNSTSKSTFAIAQQCRRKRRTRNQQKSHSCVRKFIVRKLSILSQVLFMFLICLIVIIQMSNCEQANNNTQEASINRSLTLFTRQQLAAQANKRQLYKSKQTSTTTNSNIDDHAQFVDIERKDSSPSAQQNQNDSTGEWPNYGVSAAIGESIDLNLTNSIEFNDRRLPDVIASSPVAPPPPPFVVGKYRDFPLEPQQQIAIEKRNLNATLEAQAKLHATIEQLHFNKSLALERTSASPASAGADNSSSNASNDYVTLADDQQQPDSLMTNFVSESSDLLPQQLVRTSDGGWSAPVGGDETSGGQQQLVSVSPTSAPNQVIEWPQSGRRQVDPLDTAANDENRQLGPKRKITSGWGHRKSATDEDAGAAPPTQYEAMVTWTPAAGPAAYRAAPSTGFQPEPEVESVTQRPSDRRNEDFFQPANKFVTRVTANETRNHLDDSQSTDAGGSLQPTASVNGKSSTSGNPTGRRKFKTVKKVISGNRKQVIDVTQFANDEADSSESAKYADLSGRPRSVKTPPEVTRDDQDSAHEQDDDDSVSTGEEHDEDDKLASASGRQVSKKKPSDERADEEEETETTTTRAPKVTGSKKQKANKKRQWSHQKKKKQQQLEEEEEEPAVIKWSQSTEFSPTGTPTQQQLRATRENKTMGHKYQHANPSIETRTRPPIIKTIRVEPPIVGETHWPPTPMTGDFMHKQQSSLPFSSSARLPSPPQQQLNRVHEHNPVHQQFSPLVMGSSAPSARPVGPRIAVQQTQQNPASPSSLSLNVVDSSAAARLARATPAQPQPPPNSSSNKNWSIVVLPYPRPAENALSYFSSPTTQSSSAQSAFLPRPPTTISPPLSTTGRWPSSSESSSLIESSSDNKLVQRGTRNVPAPASAPDMLASSSVPSGTDMLTINLETRPAVGPNQLFWEAAARQAAATAASAQSQANAVAKMPLTNGHHPPQHRELRNPQTGSHEFPQMRRPLAVMRSQQNQQHQDTATSGSSATPTADGYTNGHAYAGGTLKGPQLAAALDSLSTYQLEYPQFGDAMAFAGSGGQFPYAHAFPGATPTDHPHADPFGQFLMASSMYAPGFFSPPAQIAQQQQKENNSQFTKKGTALISSTPPVATPTSVSDPFGWPIGYGSQAAKSLLRINQVAPAPNYLIPGDKLKEVIAAAAANQQTTTSAGNGLGPINEYVRPLEQQLMGSHSMLRPAHLFLATPTASWPTRPPSVPGSQFSGGTSGGDLATSGSIATATSTSSMATGSQQPSKANIIHLTISTRAPTPAPSRRERFWKRLRSLRNNRSPGSANSRVSQPEMVAQRLNGAPMLEIESTIDNELDPDVFHHKGTLPEPGTTQHFRFKRSLREQLASQSQRVVRIMGLHNFWPDGTNKTTSDRVAQQSNRVVAPPTHKLALIKMPDGSGATSGGTRTAFIPLLDTNNVLDSLEQDLLHRALLYERNQMRQQQTVRSPPVRPQANRTAAQPHADDFEQLNQMMASGSMQMVSHFAPPPQLPVSASTSPSEQMLPLRQAHELLSSSQFPAYLDAAALFGHHHAQHMAAAATSDQQQRLEPPANEPSGTPKHQHQGLGNDPGGRGQASGPRARIKQLSSELIKQSKRPLTKLMQFTNRLQGNNSSSGPPATGSQKERQLATAASSPVGTTASLAQQFNNYVSPQVMMSHHLSSLENFNRFAEPLQELLFQQQQQQQQQFAKQNPFPATPSLKPQLLPLANHYTQTSLPVASVMPGHAQRVPNNFRPMQNFSISSFANPLALASNENFGNFRFVDPPTPSTQPKAIILNQNVARPRPAFSNQFAVGSPAPPPRVGGTMPLIDWMRAPSQWTRMETLNPWAEWADFQRALEELNPISSSSLLPRVSRDQDDDQGDGSLRRASNMDYATGSPRMVDSRRYMQFPDNNQWARRQQRQQPQFQMNSHAPNLPVKPMLRQHQNYATSQAVPQQQKQFVATTKTQIRARSPAQFEPRQNGVGGQFGTTFRVPPARINQQDSTELNLFLKSAGMMMNGSSPTLINYSDAEMYPSSSDQQPVELQQTATVMDSVGQQQQPSQHQLDSAPESQSASSTGIMDEQALSSFLSSKDSQEFQQAIQAAATADQQKDDFATLMAQQQQQQLQLNQPQLDPSGQFQQQFGNGATGSVPQIMTATTQFTPMELQSLPATRPRLPKFSIPSINSITNKFRQHLYQAFRLNPIGSRWPNMLASPASYMSPYQQQAQFVQPTVSYAPPQQLNFKPQQQQQQQLDAASTNYFVPSRQQFALPSGSKQMTLQGPSQIIQQQQQQNPPQIANLVTQSQSPQHFQRPRLSKSIIQQPHFVQQFVPQQPARFAPQPNVSLETTGSGDTMFDQEHELMIEGTPTLNETQQPVEAPGGATDNRELEQQQRPNPLHNVMTELSNNLLASDGTYIQEEGGTGSPQVVSRRPAMGPVKSQSLQVITSGSDQQQANEQEPHENITIGSSKQLANGESAQSSSESATIQHDVESQLHEQQQPSGELSPPQEQSPAPPPSQFELERVPAQSARGKSTSAQKAAAPRQQKQVEVDYQVIRASSDATTTSELVPATQQFVRLSNGTVDSWQQLGGKSKPQPPAVELNAEPPADSQLVVLDGASSSQSDSSSSSAAHDSAGEQRQQLAVGQQQIYSAELANLSVESQRPAQILYGSNQLATTTNEIASSNDTPTANDSDDQSQRLASYNQNWQSIHGTGANSTSAMQYDFRPVSNRTTSGTNSAELQLIDQPVILTGGQQQTKPATPTRQPATPTQQQQPEPAVFVSLKPEKVLQQTSGSQQQNRKRPLKMPKRAQQLPKVANQSSISAQSSDTNKVVAPLPVVLNATTSGFTTGRPTSLVGVVTTKPTTFNHSSDTAALKNHNLKTGSSSSPTSLRDALTRAPKAKIRWQGAAHSNRTTISTTRLKSSPSAADSLVTRAAEQQMNQTTSDQANWIIGGMDQEQRSISNNSTAQESSVSMRQVAFTNSTLNSTSSARISSLPSNHKAELASDSADNYATGSRGSRDSRTASTSFRLSSSSSSNSLPILEDNSLLPVANSTTPTSSVSDQMEALLTGATETSQVISHESSSSSTTTPAPNLERRSQEQEVATPTSEPDEEDPHEGDEESARLLEHLRFRDADDDELRVSKLARDSRHFNLASSLANSRWSPTQTGDDDDDATLRHNDT